MGRNRKECKSMERKEKARIRKRSSSPVYPNFLFLPIISYYFNTECKTHHTTSKSERGREPRKAKKKKQRANEDESDKGRKKRKRQEE